MRRSSQLITATEFLWPQDKSDLTPGARGLSLILTQGPACLFNFGLFVPVFC